MKQEQTIICYRVIVRLYQIADRAKDEDLRNGLFRRIGSLEVLMGLGGHCTLLDEGRWEVAA